MALDQLGSIGSIISGIAVVISLIYLAIQIRQNTEAGRTSTYQSIVSDFGTMNNNLAGNPELSHMFVDALENYHEFDDQEKARISQMFFQIFRFFQLYLAVLLLCDILIFLLVNNYTALLHWPIKFQHFCIF